MTELEAKELRPAWARTYKIRRGLGRARQLRKLARSIGLEVKAITELGVYAGTLSRKLRSAFPDAELTLVDMWKSLKPTGKLNASTSPEKWEEMLEKIKKDIPDATILRMMIHDAAAKVPDGSQDLIYIDGDHTYPSVKEDIEDWLPKLRDGGILAGHDYHPLQPRRNGVARAVHELLGEHNVRRFPFLAWVFVKGAAVSDPYPPAFYERRVAKFREPQRKLADVFLKLWCPASVYDLGCGIGSYLERYAERCCRVGGSDIGANRARPYMGALVRDVIERRDAGALISTPTPAYDLVQCIEVAEHLIEEAAPILAGNLRAHVNPGGHVLFSAATPGQRGRGHVHCKPADWWRELLCWAGLAYNPAETARAQGAVAEIGDPLDYAERLLVFDGPAG